jgi:hypothetical protein
MISRMPLAHRILTSAAFAAFDAKGSAQIRAAMSGLLIMRSPGLKTVFLNRNIDLSPERPGASRRGATTQLARCRFMAQG